MDQHRHSPQPTVQRSWGPVHASGPGFSTQLRSLLVPDAGIFHDNWDSPSLLSTSQQHEDGYFPIFGQVNARVNNYNPVIADSSNHQVSPTLSRLDETSVDDNAHQLPFMALSSLLDTFPGPQTRLEAPDSKFALQVDSIADGAQRSAPFDNDTSPTDDQIPKKYRIATDVVANSGDHERYKAEETQIPMMLFGAKLLPDDCSYPPTSFKCPTSGSRRLHTKPEVANRASQTHNEREHLVASAPAPPSKLYTPQDRGMRVEKMAKKLYQCSSCWVVFAQPQGLSRHRKDKHEPKNRCGFCKEFTWSKGRHYIYQRHLREEHPPSVSATMIPRRRGV
ncbi:hypothetical protein EDB89DRAFT_1233660 [Lactarius sanguifluus]|nr:hypothetical protein EDB89DRAFT_1233660 [Lactarius sanguifluus]